MKPKRTKQFAVQFVVTYVIFVVVKMLESMVLDEQIAAQRILASIETGRSYICGPIATTTSPNPISEKMQRVHLFTFTPYYILVGFSSFEERIWIEFKSLPLSFRAYCHSSLLANTRQAPTVAWE